MSEEELDKLTELIKTLSRKKYSEKHAQALHTQAKLTFGIKYGLDAFSLKLRCLIEELEHIDEEISLLEKEIEIKVAKENTNLTTIPGVSAYVAGAILGETVEYHKDNPDPRSLLAYAGLEPRIRASGKWTGTMKMSKRGSPYLRQAINIAAFYAAFHEPMFEKIYKKQLGRGKLKGVALTYVTKKMAYVVASILRTNKPFHQEGAKDE